MIVKALVGTFNKEKAVAGALFKYCVPRNIIDIFILVPGRQAGHTRAERVRGLRSRSSAMSWPRVMAPVAEASSQPGCSTRSPTPWPPADTAGDQPSRGLEFNNHVEGPWNNGKEVPRWGVTEIQKMSPSTTGRCYCCH